MDALSAVLGAVRLTGAVFLQVELRDQRSYLTAPSRIIADALMPDADHVWRRRARRRYGSSRSTSPVKTSICS